jgi:uncharacterized RDD family membrane protein YckC
VNLDISVLSPEKTVLTYRLAGLGNRILANVIDVGVIILLFVIASFSVGLIIVLLPFLAPYTQAFMILMSLLLPFGYFILLEGFWGGQTMGKKMVGIRVRMADGTPVSLLGAATRNLLRPADMLPPPYFSGLVAMFLNTKMQRIGDLVAGTIVVNDRAPYLGFQIAPHTVGIHPYENEVGELKGMNDRQYQALRRFCDRYYEIPPNVQARLIDTLYRPVIEKLRINTNPSVEPILYAEAIVMKYGRMRGLL